MINVAKVVRNPKFTQPITRIVRQETMVKGRSVLVETQSIIRAVVTMATAADLNRFTDATTYIKSILVSTVVLLNADSVGYQPDVIVYMGENFIIKGIDSYEAFGYCRAVAVLSDYQAQAGA